MRLAASRLDSHPALAFHGRPLLPVTQVSGPLLRELDALKSIGLSHCVVEVEDNADVDLISHFDRCFTFIDEGLGSGGGVLVHCFQGKSRSVCVVTGYLMSRRQMSFADATAIVREARPRAQMNLGFAAQLRRLERLGPAPRRGQEAAATSPHAATDSRDRQELPWFKTHQDWYVNKWWGVRRGVARPLRFVVEPLNTPSPEDKADLPDRFQLVRAWVCMWE